MNETRARMEIYALSSRRETGVKGQKARPSRFSMYLQWRVRRFLFYTRREFLREIVYKNIGIIAIQHSKIILFTPLAIFTILLSEIHSSPFGKFPYTYQLEFPVWRVVITIQYGKNRHTVYQFFPCVLILQSLLYPYGDFNHTTWQNLQQYIAQITKQYRSRQYGNYCHTQYVVYYHTHSKKIQWGENPQSAHRKTNYHTKCGKNCHKIFSVQEARSHWIFFTFSTHTKYVKRESIVFSPYYTLFLLSTLHIKYRT